jgi:hypothetical protein
MKQDDHQKKKKKADFETLPSGSRIAFSFSRQIAHSLLTAVEHLPRHRQPTLLIRLATFLFYTLSFSSPSELDDVWDSLKALISNRKPGEKEQLYAFVKAAASKSTASPTGSSSTYPGWDSYDPHAEFTRMKVIGESSKNLENNAWRLTSINKNFNVRFIHF